MTKSNKSLFISSGFIFESIPNSFLEIGKTPPSGHQIVPDFYKNLIDRFSKLIK